MATPISSSSSSSDDGLVQLAAWLAGVSTYSGTRATNRLTCPPVRIHLFPPAASRGRASDLPTDKLTNLNYAADGMMLMKLNLPGFYLPLTCTWTDFLKSASCELLAMHS